MTQEYSNENRGVLFKADKEGNEKRPDYSGSVNAGGKDYWLSAWVKEGKNGQKFFSLSVKEKEAKQQQAKVQSNSFDDLQDLPF